MTWPAIQQTILRIVTGVVVIIVIKKSIRFPKHEQEKNREEKSK